MPLYHINVYNGIMPTKIRYTRLERHICKTYRRFNIFPNIGSDVIQPSWVVRVTLNEKYADCWIVPNLTFLFGTLRDYCDTYKCDKEIKFISTSGLCSHSINLDDQAEVMLHILTES